MVHAMQQAATACDPTIIISNSLHRYLMHTLFHRPPMREASHHPASSFANPPLTHQLQIPAAACKPSILETAPFHFHHIRQLRISLSQPPILKDVQYQPCTPRSRRRRVASPSHVPSNSSITSSGKRKDPFSRTGALHPGLCLELESVE